ncbi:MAG: hypothetical protein CMF52_01915 [Legionellales bacterium]|nr:hypothetical protein [Legionellales bacterium]
MIRTVIILLVLSLAAVFICVSIVLVVKQRDMIYHPQRYVKSLSLPSDITPISYLVGDNDQEAYLYTKNPEPQNIWVILGGNATLSLQWYGFLESLDTKDCGYLLVDYPGYGNNEGQPSQQNNREAVLHATIALNKTLPYKKNLHMIGQSLGAAVAVDTAESINAQTIVMISPFTSIKAMATEIIGPVWSWLLLPFLQDRYPTQTTLKTLEKTQPHIKITILHGNEDKIVPVTMGRRLALDHKDWITYDEIEGAGHELNTEGLVKLTKIISKVCQTTPSKK